jgi:hypothetical protein
MTDARGARRDDETTLTLFPSVPYDRGP